MTNLKSAECVFFTRFQGSNRINNTSLWVNLFDGKLFLAVIRNVHHSMFNATIIIILTK